MRTRLKNWIQGSRRRKRERWVAGHGNASGGERNVIDNYNLAGQASGRPRALTSKAAGGRKLGVRLAVPLSQPPPDSRSRLATRQPRYMSCAAGTDCGERGSAPGRRARVPGSPCRSRSAPQRFSALAADYLRTCCLLRSRARARSSAPAQKLTGANRRGSESPIRSKISQMTNQRSVMPRVCRRELGRCAEQCEAPDNRGRARVELPCWDWPCGQDPGRKPAISRRAEARET